MAKLLTKSLFTAGVYCPELMWFSAFAKEELPEHSRAQLAIFEQGTRVGILATQRHPSGVRVDADDFKEYLDLTKELLSSRLPLFEPAFLAGRQYCRIDMLVPSNGGWDVVEVKSGTSVKEVNLWDVAFQVDTARRSGVDVQKAYILHINSDYVRKGAIDVDELFTKVDVTDDIEPFLAKLGQKTSELCRVLDSSRPKVTMLHSCQSPYGCPLPSLFPLPEHNVTQLYRSNGQEFIEQGTILIADIVDGAGLNPKQYVQWRAVTQGQPQVNKDALSKWLSSLEYPLYHFDFETFSPAVPLYENTRPYQRIPFQFSLHIEHEDGRVEHHDYLHPDSSDPRPQLLKALKILRGDGSVLAHNASFEKGVLNELLQAFPEETWITRAINRLVDTIVPFRNFWYYHPDQHGSCSLKAVLPALTTNGYDDLEVSAGDDASLEFVRITQEDVSDEERDRVRKDLLAYCKKDTEAMIDIVAALREACR